MLCWITSWIASVNGSVDSRLKTASKPQTAHYYFHVLILEISGFMIMWLVSPSYILEKLSVHTFAGLDPAHFGLYSDIFTSNFSKCLSKVYSLIKSLNQSHSWAKSATFWTLWTNLLLISHLLFVIEVWTKYVFCKKKKTAFYFVCSRKEFYVLAISIDASGKHSEVEVILWMNFVPHKAKQNAAWFLMLRLLPSEWVSFNFVCMVWQWHSNLLCLKPCQCLFACYKKINH